MLKFSVVCICFVVMAVHFCNVYCVTEKQETAILEKIKPIAKKCSVMCGVDVEYLDSCARKCILQETKTITADGIYDKDALHESMSDFKGDEDEAHQIEDQLDSCFDAKGDNNGNDEDAQIKRVDVLFKCLQEIKD